MKIDWKKVSQSPGYRSLKAAYVHDIQKGYRSKSELLKHFKWVISRATYYAHHTNSSIEEILNQWEANRNYWWLNYYQECNQPKKFGKPRNQMNYLRYRRKEVKKRGLYRNPKRIVCNELIRVQKKLSTKTPARWSNVKKRRQRNGFRRIN